MLVICLSQASSNARATRKIKIKANTHFNMLVGDDTTTGRYSLQALLTHDEKSGIVGRRHGLSQICPSTAVVMSKQQRNASGATTSFPIKKKTNVG